MIKSRRERLAGNVKCRHMVAEKRDVEVYGAGTQERDH
jgi:hypothetical protein